MILIPVAFYALYYLSLYCFSYYGELSTDTFDYFINYYSIRPDRLYEKSIDLLKELPAESKSEYLYIHAKAFFMSMLIVFSTTVGYRIKENNSSDQIGSFGNSHFATYKEVKKAGLFAPSNLILGKAYSKYIGNLNTLHTLMIAPTQSFKTTGMVIPTMLNCKTSMIVHDVKNEIYKLTSGYRKKVLNQDIVYFNPTDLYSRCYNPLDFIRKDTVHEIADAQLVANNLIDEEDNRDTYWIKEGRSILVALIIHVLHENNLPGTLGQIWELINDPEKSIEEFLEELSFSKWNIVSKTAAGFLNKSDRDRSGCISTLKSFLNLWTDPLVNKLTSTSEFSFRNFNQNNKTTLYICTPPDDIGRVKQLQKLLWAQAIKSFMARDNTEEKIVLMLDEFPALGRIDDFEEQIAYMAGFGINVVIICQDLKQLEATYRKADSIISNCKIKIAGASNDEKTAERISKWAGITTVNPTNKSRSGSLFSLIYTGRQQSHGEAPRPLINYGEVMQLPGNRILVFKEGSFPVFAAKVPYFKNKTWLKYSHIPPLAGREKKIEIDPQIDNYRTARIIKGRYKFTDTVEKIYEKISSHSTEEILKTLKAFNLKLEKKKEAEHVGVHYLYGILKNIRNEKICHEDELEKEGTDELKNSNLFPENKKINEDKQSNKQQDLF